MLLQDALEARGVDRAIPDSVGIDREPRTAGAPYWTDCAILAAAGIPSFLYGPSGDGAHAAIEWVDLESLETCVRVYLETIRDFCA